MAWIDGYYIGYRSLSQYNALTDQPSSPLLSSGTKANGNHHHQQYTFKTMYHDESMRGGTLLTSSSDLNGSRGEETVLINHHSNSQNNNNIHANCRLVSQEDQVAIGSSAPSSVHHDANSQRKYQRGAENRFAHHQQQQGPITKCTYEFVIGSLSKATKYGLV